MSSLLALLASSTFFAAVGCVVGALAGLLPGMHPNTIAAAVSSIPISSALGLSCLDDLDHEGMLLAASMAGSFLIGVMMSHSICEVIPAAMLGASNEDNVITLLPSQHLFQRGEHGLLLSSVAVGTVGGLIGFAILLVPTRCIMGAPGELYSLIHPFLGPLLLAMSVICIIRSRAAGMALCTLEFMVAGMFGIFVLTLQVPGLMNASLFGNQWSSESSLYLLPAFSGFFALPGMVLCSDAVIHRTMGSRPRSARQDGRFRAVLRSIIPSVLVGWIPGITNAYAASLTVRPGQTELDRTTSSSDYLVTYTATNIGGCLQSVVAFSTIMRARNGTLDAIGNFIQGGAVLWSDPSAPPIVFLVLIWAATISSLLGILLFLALGRLLFKRSELNILSKVKYALIAFIGIMVMLTSGPIGLLILLSSFTIGTAFLASGVPRIHLIGFLLLPVMVFFFTC